MKCNVPVAEAINDEAVLLVDMRLRSPTPERPRDRRHSGDAELARDAFLEAI